jgi:hypothetical protein
VVEMVSKDITNGANHHQSTLVKSIQSAHAIPTLIGIIEMRHGMWEKVASRSHKPSMIYTFVKGGDDVMLHGTVDYELKDGKRAEGIEWAARARFGAEEGGLKMVFYQVYLVSGPFLLCLVLMKGIGKEGFGWVQFDLYE